MKYRQIVASLAAATLLSVVTVFAQDAGSPTTVDNFQTDLFTGRFAYSIPIALPPARQGAEPKLALSYNSALGNTWCGVGWGLDTGFIQREGRNGVPIDWPANGGRSAFSPGWCWRSTWRSPCC